MFMMRNVRLYLSNMMHIFSTGKGERSKMRNYSLQLDLLQPTYLYLIKTIKVFRRTKSVRCEDRDGIVTSHHRFKAIFLGILLQRCLQWRSQQFVRSQSGQLHPLHVQSHLFLPTYLSTCILLVFRRTNAMRRPRWNTDVSVSKKLVRKGSRKTHT